MQETCQQPVTGGVDRRIAPSPMARYRKAHLRVAEILFDGQCGNIANTDVVRHNFGATAVRGYRCTKCYTLFLSLQDHPKHLFANMSHTTRNEIRRAQTDGFRYEFTSIPTTSEAERFFDFYDSFARSENLKPVVARRRVLGFLSQGVLDLSRVCFPDGRDLVWHAYLRSGQYASLLYSASLFRRETSSMAACIGRANRFLHWSDILRFRDEGFAIRFRRMVSGDPKSGIASDQSLQREFRRRVGGPI